MVNEPVYSTRRGFCSHIFPHHYLAQVRACFGCKEPSYREGTLDEFAVALVAVPYDGQGPVYADTANSISRMNLPGSLE